MVMGIAICETEMRAGSTDKVGSIFDGHHLSFLELIGVTIVTLFKLWAQPLE